MSDRSKDFWTTALIHQLLQAIEKGSYVYHSTHAFYDVVAYVVSCQKQLSLLEKSGSCQLVAAPGAASQHVLSLCPYKTVDVGVHGPSEQSQSALALELLNFTASVVETLATPVRNDASPHKGNHHRAPSLLGSDFASGSRTESLAADLYALQ